MLFVVRDIFFKMAKKTSSLSVKWRKQRLVFYRPQMRSLLVGPVRMPKSKYMPGCGDQLLMRLNSPSLPLQAVIQFIYCHFCMFIQEANEEDVPICRTVIYQTA